MPRSNFALSTEERADARKALALLTGSGLSLYEAARRAVQGKRAVQRKTVAEVADLFLRSRLQPVPGTGRPRRAATYRWYESTLSRLVNELGALHMDDVARGEFRTWLAALPMERGSGGQAQRAALARCARALWRWAAHQEPPLAGEDPTVGCSYTAPASAQTREGVLTVEQCAAALAGPHRSALALAIFAGVRPEEIAGKGKPWLRWDHVDTEARQIRIPAEISKTGKARVLEGLPDVLWAWLTPGPLRDHVSAVAWRTLQGTARDAAGYDARNRWPHDALRHTAASYLLSLTQDAGQVALWLGHEESPRMLHTRYAGLIRGGQATAKRWAALRPVALVAQKPLA